MLTARPDGPRAGKGFLGRELAAPPHQLGGLGSAVSSKLPSRSENFEFDAFWDLKIASKLCEMMVFVN